MSATAPTRPFVSVIMPVRNEASYIERSLGAVLAQTYAPDLEVLLVDGRSSDDTVARARVLAAASRSGVELRVLENPEQTAPFALNRGVEAARGTVVVRVDGHCEVGPDYVARGVAHLQSGLADGVGGALETVGETAVARAIAVAMSSRLGVGGSGFRTATGSFEPRTVDTVAFPAYLRDTLLEAGSFDEELRRNQDDELNFRLRRMGKRIALVDDMPARYYSRATLSGLLQQYFQYGLFKVRVLQKHPRQMSLRHFAPATLVAALLLATGIAPWIGGGASLLLPAVYATALVLASVVQLPRLGAATLALPIAFAALHLGYGSGFLVGLLRFAGRWGDRTGGTRTLSPRLEAAPPGTGAEP